MQSQHLIPNSKSSSNKDLARLIFGDAGVRHLYKCIRQEFSCTKVCLARQRTQIHLSRRRPLHVERMAQSSKFIEMRFFYFSLGQRQRECRRRVSVHRIQSELDAAQRPSACCIGNWLLVCAIETRMHLCTSGWHCLFTRQLEERAASSCVHAISPLALSAQWAK